MTIETHLPHLPITLTVAETADELRISIRSVYTLIANKELSAIKVGRSRRITRQALADYLDRAGQESA